MHPLTARPGFHCETGVKEFRITPLQRRQEALPVCAADTCGDKSGAAFKRLRRSGEAICRKSCGHDPLCAGSACVEGLRHGAVVRFDPACLACRDAERIHRFFFIQPHHAGRCGSRGDRADHLRAVPAPSVQFRTKELAQQAADLYADDIAAEHVSAARAVLFAQSEYGRHDRNAGVSYHRRADIVKIMDMGGCPVHHGSICRVESDPADSGAFSAGAVSLRVTDELFDRLFSRSRQHHGEAVAEEHAGFAADLFVFGLPEKIRYRSSKMSADFHMLCFEISAAQKNG